MTLIGLSRTLLMGFVVTIVACDMRNELKDMHKSTGNMEKNTEKMVEITDRMEKNTQKMGDDVEAMKKETKDVNESIQGMQDKMNQVNDNINTFNKKVDGMNGTLDSLERRVGTGIEETYDGLRQGDSSNLRRIAFQGLIQAKSHEKKLLEASQYLAGFEFYFWRGFGIDNKKQRLDDLLSGAAEQFYKDIYELYNYKPGVFAMADPELGEAFNKEASFNSIAATLHRDNPKQKENIALLAAKGIQIEEMNFLKIIKKGLLAKADVESKKTSLDQVPGYLKEVINNEPISIKLLQARWNFLAIAALDKNFHFKQNGAFRYMRSAWGLVTKWELDFSKLNSGQIADQNLYLRMAKDSRDFLNSIGVETKPDVLLVAFINRMKPVKIDKLSASNNVVAAENLQIINSFKK
ncbi:MAG: hypothetical protein JNL11_04375 [Bdellovibrionaceae bacterium]|nr:hypothetical protein [Pseudobdellovibrionaceae bacterium]